eukprot:SAG11_NODE_30603_length_299_cov_1.040000_1_plen_56_part_10
MKQKVYETGRPTAYDANSETRALATWRPLQRVRLRAGARAGAQAGTQGTIIDKNFK